MALDKARAPIILLLSLIILCSCSIENRVGQGKQITIEYSLSVDGKQIDTSKDCGNLVFRYGAGQIISGVEKRITGMRVGETKEITIPPEEAFGASNINNRFEAPRAVLPKELEPYVGGPIRITAPDGSSKLATVVEVKQDTVILEYSHPLAGKTLKYQVKIVAIEG